MHRLAILALGVLAVSTSVSRGGNVKKYDDLTSVELASLQASEERLAANDRALEALDRDWQLRRVGRSDYVARSGKIESEICEEASFQNAILSKAPSNPTGKTDAVLRTVGKVAVAIPAAALEGLAGAHATITP